MSYLKSREQKEVESLPLQVIIILLPIHLFIPILQALDQVIQLQMGCLQQVKDLQDVNMKIVITNTMPESVQLFSLYLVTSAVKFHWNLLHHLQEFLQGIYQLACLILLELSTVVNTLVLLLISILTVHTKVTDQLQVACLLQQSILQDSLRTEA